MGRYSIASGVLTAFALSMIMVGGSSLMANNSKSRNDTYAWGLECADWLSVGLSVASDIINVSSPLRWRWALHNVGDTTHEVTVQYDLDISFRYRLLVSRAGSKMVLEEFIPLERQPITTNGLAHNIKIPPDSIIEFEEENALIGARLGKGDYTLRVLFGGKDFDFECVSGGINIRII